MTLKWSVQLNDEGKKLLEELSVVRLAKEVLRDADAILERDPAAVSRTEVLLLYSGLHALFCYRIAHRLDQLGYPLLARAISQGAKFLTGIEIHPAAKIGSGLFIDHGSGVVIGETSVIGDDCTIYQGVTLGGTGKETGKRHPTLGDRVMVGAGAKLLGAVNIGSDSKIAAGAVVLKDVPSHSTAVGIPARVVSKKTRTATDLDQIHIPDPVSAEIRSLKEKTAKLEKAILAFQMKDGEGKQK